MKKLSLLTLMLGLAALNSAQADLIFNITKDYSSGSGLGTGPYGTVTLAQGVDGNTVNVTVTLASGYNFANTGAGDALGFDLAGNPAITISGLTSGFTQDTSAPPIHLDGTGNWEYGVGWTGGPGGSTPSGTNLTFSVSVASGGLTPSSFVQNPNGLYFVTDLLAPNGNTGDAAVVPEPTTMVAGALLLLPFGASTLRVLRKNRTK